MDDSIQSYDVKVLLGAQNEHEYRLQLVAWQVLVVVVPCSHASAHSLAIHVSLCVVMVILEDVVYERYAVVVGVVVFVLVHLHHLVESVV